MGAVNGPTNRDASAQYHVDRHPEAVKALPLIWFNIMNTINTIHWFLSFPNCGDGRAPRDITLPITPPSLVMHRKKPKRKLVGGTHDKRALDTAEAWETFAAKVSQAEFANWHCAPEIPFACG